jgi:hypothetical protein
VGELLKPLIFSRHSCLLGDGLFASQEKAVSISCDIVNLQDTTPYKVYVQFEPIEIVSDDSLVTNHGFYDLILAWHDHILSTCPNAVKFVGQSEPCCRVFEGVLSCQEVCRVVSLPFLTIPLPEKKFSVSMLISEKRWLPGHIFRHEVFHRLPATFAGSIPIVKHVAPPHLTCGPRAQMIAASQYCIAIENSQWPGYFTEKILDCFLTRTIPLYWGCPTIDQYFNMDGVLRFQTYEELAQILSTLTPESYAQRAVAIEDNYQRASEYWDVCSRISHVISRSVDR